jgi:hypothetical protein
MSTEPPEDPLSHVSDPNKGKIAKQQLPRLDVAIGPSRMAAKDQVIERFEQKYIIHPRLVPQIRKYLEPFCIPDPNGKGEIPEYVVTTLQLDTPLMDLALAKERKTFSRFKLRIRGYGIDANPNNPVFLELKRKVGQIIIKSRSKMKRQDYIPGMLLKPETMPMLKTAKDNVNMMEFARITNHIAARPRMLIRYIRESYFGANDDYARITFDRRISYRTTRSWDLPDESLADWKHWRPMDTQTGFRRPFAGYVFELKAMRDAPRWMLDLVERFNLTTTGFCKYATAYRLETLFRGNEYSCSGENTTLTS